MKLLRQGEGNSGRRRHRAPAATHCGARATSTGGMLARSTARARRKMLALPQLRPKKATPWSEAGDAMPIRGNNVLATLPSPARKGLLRCEIRTGLWSPDGGTPVMRLACCPLPPFGHSLRRAERELRGTGRALPATGACSLLPFTGKVPEGRMGEGPRRHTARPSSHRPRQLQWPAYDRCPAAAATPGRPRAARPAPAAAA
ncbi:hypothetical protein BI312_12530 [Xanthomonas citri pv. citri]|nr:hypothetical protein BI314_02440 [Xanthomonas citri pv. citri]QYF47166.1 hypothetical protein HZS93_04542 [Xanthomonas citri]APR15531.1 hypothetical protein BI315_12460 [Xanthomonas citri pv. citri]APR18266.1 hypothetical protein BI316_00500 [Xanthomonas citri pv. citri]APR25691.1 hypothetical protein BJD09_17430 [Xanthomonas citri pv. citri]